MFNITACYWSGDGPTSGIGFETDTATKVENDDWSTAMSTMNGALENDGWEYYESDPTDGAPILLRKKTE